MIRIDYHANYSSGGLPRMRGDDPDVEKNKVPAAKFAPHARG